MSDELEADAWPVAPPLAWERSTPGRLTPASLTRGQSSLQLDAREPVALDLASVTDWDGFSHAVRHLRAAGVSPESVRWRVAGSAVPDLFDETSGIDVATLPRAPALRLPKSFVDGAREVFLHADEARLPLLHRLASRIADDALAWSDPLHAGRLQFDRFLREVRREIHKMHAFVRFRRIDEVADGDGGEPPVEEDGVIAVRARHVAWFEPAHHVLEAAAPFFARRFSRMRWAILTPRSSALWDGQALSFGPGARRDEAPDADAGEGLWLDYYRSIFNPARVKVAMMKREMPVRFWKNLPEAAAIGPLLAQAPGRRDDMIAAGGASRERRRGHVGIALRDDVEPEPGEAGLDALRRQAARCRDCPVADVATQTVFGEGHSSARLMIVGEQPGDREDLLGRPFQGPAGQLLHAAFEELGWAAADLYLTNAVKHFHHELRGKRRLHRTPAQREAEACLHWLDAEIETLRPQAIVALGATAARSLLGRDARVLDNQGRWMTRDDGVPVLLCLHPAAILRADTSRQAGLRERWIATLRQASAFATPE